MGRVLRVVRGTHLQTQVQGSASCPASRVSALLPSIDNSNRTTVPIQCRRGPPIAIIVVEVA